MTDLARTSVTSVASNADGTARMKDQNASNSSSVGNSSLENNAAPFRPQALHRYVNASQGTHAMRLHQQTWQNRVKSRESPNFTAMTINTTDKGMLAIKA